MNNFTHDIPLPDDPAIRKFLWISYFHDAIIQEIHPGKPTYKDLTLRVFSPHDGFTYLLRFHGVEHFSCSKDNYFWHTGIDIASTVFKDTALLHRLEKEAEKSLYHLRFSFWDGYMDVIFAKFTIRREGGRVSYKPEYDPAVINWKAYRYAPNGYWLRNAHSWLISPTPKARTILIVRSGLTTSFGRGCTIFIRQVMCRPCLHNPETT